MKQPPQSLDDLQRWMLDVITNPSVRDTDQNVEHTILPSRQQSAAERLAVYQHAYVARLLEVLREQFPCTRFAAGDELFDQFVLGYLRVHPPYSYTLARLADHLPDYLDATRPADWGAFVVELARVEQAIDRIFDGPGPEGAAPFVFPTDADESLRLAFVPGFELQALRFPVSAFYTDWKTGSEPSWPDPREQFVALFRREYIVRRHELSPMQFKLLAALQAGKTLGEALTAVAESLQDVALDELAAGVHEWFARWTAAGFFLAVR